jgi:hypothetical protein
MSLTTLLLCLNTYINIKMQINMCSHIREGLEYRPFGDLRSVLEADNLLGTIMGT